MAFAHTLDRLGSAIVTGELSTGHADTFEGLVERIGASRSVVREVSRVLGSLGMLSAGRLVGLRVLAPEYWDVLDPLFIRWRRDGADAQTQIDELRTLRRAIEPAADAAAAGASRPAARPLRSDAPCARGRGDPRGRYRNGRVGYA